MSLREPYGDNMVQKGDFCDTSVSLAPASWSALQPYNQLPRLPPPHEIESRAVLKHCITARAALAALNQATALLPNPTMLINTLPLLEARASSEIENIVTTADKLFQHLQAESAADPATKEALRYRSALMQGVAALAKKPVCIGLAEQVCSEIEGTTMQIRRLPGTALASDSTGAIIYTPPEGEPLLRDLLSNWEHFMHNATEVDPLVRMAVAHYQFEAIHPFTDGNGRTGRVLNTLFIMEQQLLTLPVLYLSRFIIAHKADYYRRLLDVTRTGAWEPWLIYMLTAIAETAAWTTLKIAAIRTLADETAVTVKTKLPKIYSRDLVDVIFEQPYCRIQNLTERGIAGRQAAARYLKALVEVGLLRELAIGRDKLFVNIALMQLLTSEA